MSQIANRRERTGSVDPMANRLSGGRRLDEQSTGELVQHASEQITQLVREEMALARAELTEKGRHAGMGAGLIGGGGLLALYGLGVLLVVAVLALDEVMPAWLAALIVAVAVFIAAGVLALLGRRQVQQATPPMPEQAAQSVRADMDRMAAAVRDRATPGPSPSAAARRPTTGGDPTTEQLRTGGGR